MLRCKADTLSHNRMRSFNKLSSQVELEMAPALEDPDVLGRSGQTKLRAEPDNTIETSLCAKFVIAVDEIAAVTSTLLSSLETNALPKNRIEEAARARERTAQRFPR
jgi:hypothetical protein